MWLGEATRFQLHRRGRLVCMDLRGFRNWCWLCAVPQLLRPRLGVFVLVTVCIPVDSVKASNMLGWAFNSKQRGQESLKLLFFCNNIQRGVVIMGISYVLTLF